MVGSIWGGSLGASVIKNAGASLSSLSLYDALGFTSNVLAIINGLKVAQYLTHIHGNPPSVSWFIDNLYKVDKFSKFFGYVAALIDGIGVYRNTNDIGKAIFTTGYDIGGMIIASSLGGFIGSTLGILLGGPAGAIIGTLAGIGIESLIQYFKEDVVNWVDKTFDDFIYWISNKWGDLINA